APCGRGPARGPRGHGRHRARRPRAFLRGTAAPPSGHGGHAGAHDVKLSFSTLACPSWSLAEILDAAGRLGYDGVELRFIAGDDALWARPELNGAGLRETLGRLRDAALAISCVDTRSFFHDPPGPQRERALEEALRSLELAARLGAGGIRVFGDRVQP